MFRFGRALCLVAAASVAAGGGTSLAAPPRPAKLDNHRSALARQAFEDGKKAYTAGEFDKAIELWRQAYEYRDDANFLYNIAQAYRQKGEAQNAIFFYRAYLRESPKARNRAEVEARIVELAKLPASPPPPVGEPARPPGAEVPSARPAIAEPASTASEAFPDLGPPPFAGSRDDEPATSARPGRPLVVVGLVTGSAGVAALATGIVFGLKARSIQNDLEARQKSDVPWDAAEKDLEAEGSRDNVIGIAGMAVGAAAVLTGATLIWLGARKNDAAARASRISVEIAPRAVRASLSF